MWSYEVTNKIKVQAKRATARASLLATADRRGAIYNAAYCNVIIEVKSTLCTLLAPIVLDVLPRLLLHYLEQKLPLSSQPNLFPAGLFLLVYALLRCRQRCHG